MWTLRNNVGRLSAPLLLPLLLAAVSISEQPAEPSEEGLRLYREHVAPLLKKNCFACHSHAAKKSEGGLVVDSRGALLTGGYTGPAIVPGDADESLLIGAVTYKDLEMPPKRKLADADIQRLKRWIDLGAPAPDEEHRANKGEASTHAAKDLWSLRPLTSTQPPQVTATAWPASEIDHFILHKLEAQGLQPVADADRRTLLRRVYFDLVGLPPTPEQMRQFLEDDSPQAYAKVVDALLDSPHFGEKWGRHWMDVVRYADSVGGGGNTVYDNAWKYRDWIIRSLNEDKPYDQFLVEQIAGDLLPGGDARQRSQRIIATGFLAVGRKELPEYDKEKLRMDVVDEQLDTLGKAFLGLSLGCARCHDHKFDPISSGDYYAMAGIFESTETMLPPKGGPLSTWVKVNLPDKSGEALAVRERKAPIDSRICVRGDVHHRGKLVPRGFLSALPMEASPPAAKQSGRLELARWVAATENPLTSRVMVNRIWHWLMGRGLVATPDNFGVRGSPPSHPELLDHLAWQFIEDGWSVKKTVRRIVLSRTYRLGAAHDAAAARHDPDNVLRWRFPRRRLDAEIIRDAMLTVSGELDPAHYGKTLTFTGRLDEAKEKKLDSDPWRRRSVYLPRYREDKQVDIMVTFDAAHPAMVTGQRSHTTVPTQALYLLNSPFVKEQAEKLASSLLAAKDLTDGQRVELTYRRVLTREPTSEEIAADLRFLDAVAKAAAEEDTQRRHQAWTNLCHTLLACNEFLFVD